MVNSRTKGHDYERKIVQDRRAAGYEKAMTSRLGNLAADYLGIDVINTGNFTVQCKCYKAFPVARAIRVLKAMPQDDNINIVHIKITNKGDVVVLDKKDFMSLVQNAAAHKEPVQE